MLKELYVENYKSLKNVTVQFKDGLNIIIGKNGSGKSNLLEFINEFVSIKPLVFFENKVRFPSNYSYSFYPEQQSEKNEFIFKVVSELSSEGRVKGLKNVISISQRKIDGFLSVEKYVIENKESWTEINRVINALSFLSDFHNNLIKFYIPGNLWWLDKPTKYTINSINSPFYLIERPSEYSLFTHLFNFRFEKELSENDDKLLLKFEVEEIKMLFIKCFDKFKKEIQVDNFLNAFSPIESVKINENINIYKIEDKILFENLTLEFKIDGDWVPWSYLSDGTKRLFFLITEISSQEDGLILVEEPELGVHPDQLFKLMQFIKEQSETKQIIISTHSPIVLDCLKSDELDRIIIARAENGHSHFHKLSEKKIEKAKNYIAEAGDLSYYWLHSDMEDSND